MRSDKGRAKENSKGGPAKPPSVIPARILPQRERQQADRRRDGGSSGPSGREKDMPAAKRIHLASDYSSNKSGGDDYPPLSPEASTSAKDNKPAANGVSQSSQGDVYGTPSVPKPHVSETCEMFLKHVRCLGNITIFHKHLTCLQDIS